MSLTVQEVSKLNRIIRLAETLIQKGTERSTKGRNGKSQLPTKSKRIRRTGPELVRFRKMLKAERKKGIPVAALARKYGVSTAYIYVLP